MEDAINSQANAELYSGYLYLSMSAYLSSIDMPGAAHWMRCQAEEELVHAMKFLDYVVERGGRVTLTAIEAPPLQWQSPVAVAQHTLAHERKVTGLITDLAELATDRNDEATRSFLQWYIDEQEEEEESAEELVEKLKTAAEGAETAAAVDEELGRRPVKLVEAAKEH